MVAFDPRLSESLLEVDDRGHLVRPLALFCDAKPRKNHCRGDAEHESHDRRDTTLLSGRPPVHYPAKLNALIPVPRVKLAPTAPTTAVLRVRPSVARSR